MRYVNLGLVVALSLSIYILSYAFSEYAVYMRAFSCVLVGMYAIYDVLSRVE